jgi:hypothetical protein
MRSPVAFGRHSPGYSMRLTQQTSYSIRALLYCSAQGDRPSRIRDIARTYGISELHLFKIMHVLVENRLLPRSAAAMAASAWPARRRRSPSARWCEPRKATST